MKKYVLALGLVILPALVFAADTTSIKTALQASLQRDLQRSLINGALTHIDLATGEVQEFYPTDTHPMIVAVGDHFVMCSDMMAKDGSTRPVDFYMVSDGRGYRIFRTEIGNREPLMALMDKGVAAPFE